MAAKTLSSVVSESVAFTKAHQTALLTGAVVFGLVMQGLTWGFAGTTGVVGAEKMGTWQQQMEQMGTRMEALQQRAAEGALDAVGQKEMEDLSRQMMAEAMSGAGMLKGVMMTMLPAVGFSILIALLIGIAAKSYYLVIAVKSVRDPKAAAGMTFNWIVSLVGLWLWLILRSFIWIPVIGVIVAIIVGPRLILSPLYLLEHKKGITESARLSYTATEGYWGKIVGNSLAVGILTGICAGIVSRIITAILGVMLGGFIGAIISQCVAAFLVVFSIHLARTVMANPLKA